MDAPATLGAALVAARGRIPQSEARLFLRAIAGVSAAQLAAYPERDLTPAQAARFAESCRGLVRVGLSGGLLLRTRQESQGERVAHARHDDTCHQLGSGRLAQRGVGQVALRAVAGPLRAKRLTP